MLTQKHCDDTSLKDEVERHWREIIKHSYHFEQQQAEVCVFRALLYFVYICMLIDRYLVDVSSDVT